MRRLFALLGLLLLAVGIPGAQAQPVFSPCAQAVNVVASATTLIAAPAATSRVYVCLVGVSATAALTFTIIEGTGSTCQTGTTTLGTFPLLASTPLVLGGSGAAFMNTQTKGDSLCISVTASTVSGMVSFAFGP